MKMMSPTDKVIWGLTGDWPPARRCGNCANWHSGRLAWFFGLKGKMGKCQVINDTSWHTYTCPQYAAPQVAQPTTGTTAAGDAARPADAAPAGDTREG